MTQPEDTTLEEWRYNALLKTMLAEVYPSDDPVFQTDDREKLEHECLEAGMDLPIVRVIPNGD